MKISFEDDVNCETIFQGHTKIALMIRKTQILLFVHLSPSSLCSAASFASLLSSSA